MADVTERLRTELTAAMRRRDTAAVAALRSALAAVANAEAVPGAQAGPEAQGPATVVTSPHVAGAAAGAGAAEVARRQLDAREVAAIVRAELATLQQAADHAAASGQAARAERLQAEVAALRHVLDGG
jgi:hypothetical protein